jgi:hypothetical protein
MGGGHSVIRDTAGSDGSIAVVFPGDGKHEGATGERKGKGPKSRKAR